MQFGLVLSRRVEEQIYIGDDIVITVVAIMGDKCRLGILAPKSLSVHRKEVYDDIKREQLRNEGRTNEEADGAE